MDEGRTWTGYRKELLQLGACAMGSQHFRGRRAARHGGHAQFTRLVDDFFIHHRRNQKPGSRPHTCARFFPAQNRAGADDETVTVQPLKSFPVMRDLVTDVSWNYEQNS